MHSMRRLAFVFDRVGNRGSQEARVEERCGLLSAKGGLMMGTKKVGAFSSPLKKATTIIAEKGHL